VSNQIARKRYICRREKIPLACITTGALGYEFRNTDITFTPETLPAGETVVITEGALKAETLVSFRPKARVIATAGVSCSHDQIIEAARPYNVLTAFDADHRTNSALCRQLARLIVQRDKDSKERIFIYRNQDYCLDGPKGFMMQSGQIAQ